MEKAYQDNNLSLTINDLTVDAGLLDMTCSALISSPDNSPTKKGDHDFTMCSCHGDGPEDPQSTDSHDPGVNQSIEISRAGDVPLEANNEELKSQAAIEIPLELGDGNTKPNREETEDRPLFLPLSTENNKNRMPLFNDTSFNLSKFLDDYKFNNEKSFNTRDVSSIRLSLANTTDFYSLHAGSIHDFSDDDGDGSEGENIRASEPSSLDSHLGPPNGPPSDVVDIDTLVGNVSFTKQSCINGVLKEKNQINEFLSSNGDIDAEKFHGQTLEIEGAFKEKETVFKELCDALQDMIERNRAKENENEELLLQIGVLEEQLRKKREEDLLSIRQTSPDTPEPETLSSQSDLPNSEVEDLRLQVQNLEKKLEADRKYLEIQTAERELEQDDYQKTICNLTAKIEDMKREKDHLENLISNQKSEIEDYEFRLKEEMEAHHDASGKHEKAEEELHRAVDKVMELRDIIRELEGRIDVVTQTATEIKDENLILQEEVARLEQLCTKDHDTSHVCEDCSHQCVELGDELPAQVEDLFHRIERKVNDMDIYHWSTRPNSSCSNAVSNEDVSVARDVCCVDIHNEAGSRDVASQLAAGIQKLDTLFESLVRFEEIIMKKLRDAEIRTANSKKVQEELESDKQALQEKVKSQMMAVSDLQNSLDKYRFETTPSAGTLSGLRARVLGLTGELEDLQGKLQLKELEMQDMKEKIAEKDALLRKAAVRNPDPPIYITQKHDAIVQTEIVLPKVLKPAPQAITANVSCQTERVAEVPKQFTAPKTPVNKFVNSGVQTVFSAIKAADYLEISSIQGVIPVTHSTPNDGSGSKSSARIDRGAGTLWSEEQSELSNANRTPEILREPADSRLNHSFMSDRYASIINRKEPLPALPKSANNPEGDEVVDVRGRNTGREWGEPLAQGSGVHKNTQTPPLGLSNIVNVMDEDEKHKLLQVLSKSDVPPGSGNARTDTGGSAPSSKAGSSAEDSDTGRGPGESKATRAARGNPDSSSSKADKAALGRPDSSLPKLDKIDLGGPDSSPSKDVRPTEGGTVESSSNPNFGVTAHNGTFASPSKMGIAGPDEGSRVSTRGSSDTPDWGSILDVPLSELTSSGPSSIRGDAMSSSLPPEVAEVRADQRPVPPLKTSAAPDGDQKTGKQGESCSSLERVPPTENTIRPQGLSTDHEGVDCKDREALLAALEDCKCCLCNLCQDIGPGVNGDPPVSPETAKLGLHGDQSNSDFASGGGIGGSNLCRADPQDPNESLFKPGRAEAAADCACSLCTSNDPNALNCSGGRSEQPQSIQGASREQDSSLVPRTDADTGDLNIEDIEQLACIDSEFSDPEYIIPPSPGNHGECVLEFQTTCEFQVDVQCNSSDGSMPVPSKDLGSSQGHPVEHLETYRYTEKTHHNVPVFSSHGEDACGSHGVDAPQPRAVHQYDWQSMEKTKEGRMNETGAKIELETLKTRMGMIQKALETEKRTNESLSLQLSALKKLREDHHQLNRLYCHEHHRNTELMQQMERLAADVQTLQLKCLRLQEIEEREAQMRSQGVGEHPLHANTVDSAVQGSAALVAQNNELMREMRRLQDMFNSALLPCDGPAPAITPGGGLQRAEISQNQQIVPKGSSQRWFELYMRAKSYRKALAWQKKYLGIVIQGYKDILTHTAGAYEHPDLLQREIPLTPSAVGLCNRKEGKTRFRIIGRVVLASIRMKYMVHRWVGKSYPRSAPDLQHHPRSESSRYASASSNSDTESTESDQCKRRSVKFAASPPTKESSHKSSRSAPQQRLFKPLDLKDKCDAVSSTENSTAAKEIVFKKPAPRTFHIPSQRTPVEQSSQGESLSEYFERFQSLQNDIGSALVRETRIVVSKPQAEKPNK